MADTPSTPLQNQVPNEPQLSDLLDLHKRDVMFAVNCHHIGTVQSFDAAAQTAKATINYTMTYFKKNAQTGQYDPVPVQYPLLIDAPVISLGGAKGALTFPVAAGDECLILFNDRDINNWFTGGSGSQVASNRLHSFSDGLILVGVRSLANVLSSFNTTDVELRNDQIKMALTPTQKFKVTNTTGELIAALYNILTTATAGGFPLVIDPTNLAVLESFKAT